MTTTRRITRYGSSRKLYDTVDRRYVGLDDIASLIRQGEMVKAVDSKSGADVTAQILTQVILEEGKKGTWLVPTMNVYYDHWAPEGTSQGILDRKRAAVHGPSLQKAVKAGVKIAFGTDVGGFSWSDPIAREFSRMVEFGMTPMAAIQAATSKAAELLSMEGDVGVVAPGGYADIVAVAGDPLKDVRTLEAVGFVMKDGKVYRDELK